MSHKYETWFVEWENNIPWIYNMLKETSACYRVSFCRVAVNHLYIKKMHDINIILLSIHVFETN